MVRSLPDRCDRCGEDNPQTHLTGYPLVDVLYWLCPDCIQAILLIWLVEHEPGIQATRRTHKQEKE